MLGSRAQEILRDALSEIAAAESKADLSKVTRAYLGKGGAVGRFFGSLREVPVEERPRVGAEANELKSAIAERLEARAHELARSRLERESAAEDFDPTLPGAPVPSGSLHPVTLVTRELEDIFSSMGYLVLDGPEVELDTYNFEALNIPADHPAREMHDTFWCGPPLAERSSAIDTLERSSAIAAAQKLLLRTHTSPVQIRALERLEPPFRAVVPGRCFRNETVDASHDHTFHQMEGLVVDEGVTVGHLIGTLKTFLREVFARDLEVRLRPGYFPFVEPGLELDVRCPFCERGCSVCKRSTWIELCPCGMVHPKVLRYGGVDPERYTGFAFGLGLSRLVMLRYGIDDIRNLLAADLRFLEQFPC